VRRDIRDIAQIERLSAMPKLLKILGQYSGQLVNYTKIGSPLNINHVTTRKYVDIFESIFLVHSLQPWHSNKLKRLNKTHKLHFYDSGLLAAVNNIHPDAVLAHRTKFGALLETFVFGELVKQSSWANGRYTFSHYRDKDQREVDFVIEDQAGRVLGVEVKASSTVRSADFAGMKKLAKACGDQFVGGVVLYDHEETIPFGNKLAAIPISTLWA